jgi:threonine dehydrogenase-like Zn-dependent dehydrogenase
MFETEALHFLAPGRAELRAHRLPPLRPNDVRVRTVRTGICMRELNVFSGRLPRALPAVMGHEPIGVVESVGGDVRSVRPGDRVTALGDESFARHFQTSEDRVAPISPGVKDWMNWLGEPAMCVANGIRSARVEPGDTVVLIGAGFMGLLLAQVLLRTPLSRLIVIENDNARLALAERFGVTHRIEAAGRSNSDLVQAVGGLADAVDVVIEASGAPGTLELGGMLLRRGGTLAVFSHHVEPEIVDLNTWHLKGLAVLNVVPWFSKNLIKDFQDGVRLLSAGVVRMGDVISHRIDFDEAPAAFPGLDPRPNGYIKGVLDFETGP